MGKCLKAGPSLAMARKGSQSTSFWSELVQNTLERTFWDQHVEGRSGYNRQKGFSGHPDLTSGVSTDKSRQWCILWANKQVLKVQIFLLCCHCHCHCHCRPICHCHCHCHRHCQGGWSPLGLQRQTPPHWVHHRHWRPAAGKPSLLSLLLCPRKTLKLNSFTVAYSLNICFLIL